MNPVDQIIERLGGVANAAKAFGVAHPSVIKWRKRGELPIDRLAVAVELTGIPAADLRPDLAAAFAPREVA